MKVNGLVGAAIGMLLFSFSGNAGTLNLPPSDINLAVKSGTVSFFNITLSEVPAGYSVANKTYAAWCVDLNNEFDPSLNGGLHTGYLLDVTGGGLPANYADVPWDKINYLLNHKQGTVDDVQRAIWYYTDGFNPDPNANPVSLQLIADADANGGGFVPSAEQISAALIVWTAPNPAEQGNIIEVPGAPNITNNTCSDRFTAGGFIYRDGSKVTFGIQGGVQNGRLWGGINFVDHDLNLHVQSRSIISYAAVDANCRQAVYECTINGEAGTATVVACDYGEPGRNDVLTISLSNGYEAGQGTTLGGSGNGGGNVQLHKASCGEPPSAKPNPGGGKPKKPHVGNDDGNGKPPSTPGNGHGNGNDKGGGKGKGKGNGNGNGKGPKVKSH